MNDFVECEGEFSGTAEDGDTPRLAWEHCSSSQWIAPPSVENGFRTLRVRRDGDVFFASTARSLIVGTTRPRPGDGVEEVRFTFDRPFGSATAAMLFLEGSPWNDSPICKVGPWDVSQWTHQTPTERE